MDNKSDLEICKRIAEIEGKTLVLSGLFLSNMNFAHIKTIGAYGAEMSQIYNPLTDDALCFQLMVKYKISLIQHQNNNAVYCIWNHDEKHATKTTTNPNRAICLAIIEAHKDQS